MANNDYLNDLVAFAKDSGAIKSSETTKQNIYQEKYFAGITNETEERKVRRVLRNLAINFLSLLASANDKKSFEQNFSNFEKFYKDTYVSESIDFSVFDTLRKDSTRKVIEKAKSNFAKYSK